MLDLNDFGFGCLSNSQLLDLAVNAWTENDTTMLKFLAEWLRLAGEPELAKEISQLI